MGDLTRNVVINLLEDLNSEDLLVISEGLNNVCRKKSENLFSNLSLDELRNFLSRKTNFEIPLQSFQEEHVCANIYLLCLLSEKLGKNDLLSVQETKKLRTAFRNITTIGIFPNIVPKLPLYKEILDDYLMDPLEAIKTRYNRLIFVLDFFVHFIKVENYRTLIVPELLKAILVGLYQILYCPLKKSSDKPDGTGFHMTETYHKKLLEDRHYFKQHFEYLANSIYKPIYTRETMLLVTKTAPVWFTKAVSSQLNHILISKKGVEYVSAAMFNGTTNDSTRTWNTLDAITNLIFDCRKSFSFSIVCQQVVDLLKHKNSPLFERIFICITKSMYLEDPAFCEQVFVKPVLNLLIRFTNKSFGDNEEIADDVKQTVRILHSLFVERHGERGVLPANLLKPSLVVLFRLHTMVNSVKSISYDTKDVIVKYLKGCNNDEIFGLFDACLFSINNTLDIKNLHLIIDGEKITTKYIEQTIICTPEENGEVLLELLKNNVELRSKLFAYLLNCLVHDEKYFKSSSSRDLLEQEEDFIIDKGTQRKLVVFKVLANLAEDKDIQEHIANNPDEIINYMEIVFKRTVQSELLKHDSSSDGFQSVFTLSMILQLLVENGSAENLSCFEGLSDLLLIMIDHCSDRELKDLLRNISQRLLNKEQKSSPKAREKPNELDLAFEEICDPLLPIRAHGLMSLIELVKKKDENAVQRITYIQNIFKQNLKTEDSYLYLRAVEGLAAVSLVLPDAGLRALTEEYADFSRKDTDDGVEVRMKVGEVLVRVTRMLGEMCPHYKDILLNTFLTGTRDEDHLIRASSLSNLAEVCEVLGYKLGSIVTEILTCVQAIVATDKQIEPRRAAVTVIRQLLRGLGDEMIFFLKDTILPIYRELKFIYNKDEDEVMKLQAQLALEELNENMKEFIFPTPKLNIHVKPIVMK